MPNVRVTASPSARSGMTRLVQELLRPYRGWLVIILARDARRNGDEPGRSVAPEDRARQRRSAITRCRIGSTRLVGPEHRRPQDGRSPRRPRSASWSSPCSARSPPTSTTTTPRASASTSPTTCACGSTTTSTACRSPTTTRSRPGTCSRTITTDIATIQDFASAATLGILVDLLTIVGMLGLMFWLNWDFALIAVGVTPFLLLFVMRFKKRSRRRPTRSATARATSSRSCSRASSRCAS